MIKLALVGCGGMANGHAATLAKMPEVTLVGFCDIVRERAEAYRVKHAPEAAVFDSFETMLSTLKGKLDGVVLVTPHTLHFPHATAALEAGLHVLVEKPMVTSSDHAYALWRTVNKTGKKLAIAFQASYCAEFQCIAQMRDAGELGKVQLIQGWLAQGWRESQKNTWRQDPAQSGGGQMYDSGAHVLNAMMWLMNEPVVEVSCMYDRCDTPVDINGVAIMKFEGGALGSVCIGGNSAGWDAELRIQTDTGQIHTGPHGGSLDVKLNGRKFYPTVPTSDAAGAFTPHRNFVDAILGKAQLVAPVRYGVLLSALMDAIYESADKQLPVKVRPVPASLD